MAQSTSKVQAKFSTTFQPQQFQPDFQSLKDLVFWNGLKKNHVQSLGESQTSGRFQTTFQANPREKRKKKNAFLWWHWIDVVNLQPQENKKEN